MADCSASATRRLAAAALVAMAASACMPQGELGGSLGASVGLRFDRIRAYWLTTDLCIIYEADLGTESSSKPFGDPIANQVVRLTFHAEALELEPRVDILFSRHETPNLPLSVERYVLDDATGVLRQDEPLPEVAEAKVRFDDLSTARGHAIKGTFDVTFVDDRFLWGSFDTTLSAP